MSHTQKEAFCHMLYRAASGREISIWNSRDGVTPFGVSIDGEELEHVEWSRDRYDPDHVPKVGTYVFVDLTIDAAVVLRTKYVEHFWNHPETPMSAHGRWKTPEQAIMDLAESDVASFDGHTPHKIKVTADWVSGFLAGRRNKASRVVRMPPRGGRFA